MTISKKTILCVLIITWIMFSITYIVFDVWSDFKDKQLTQAYRLGEADTINQLIKEAGNEKCEPFFVYNNDANVQLINIECLKQVSEEKFE